MIFDSYISQVTNCLTGKPASVMRRRVVDTRAQRDDPIRIDRRVASIIVPLYVLHVHGAAHTRDLINVLRIIKQIWVFSQHFLVALKVNHINLDSSKHEQF